jgi:RsiW-degrading membrane proteinase PrsW (M82 family)
MYRLIVQTGSPAGRQIHFDHDVRQYVLLGRGEECDLRFTDAGVCLRHAIIVFENGRLSISDQGSFNGVFVNGVRIEAAALRRGDLIELSPGGPQLQVLTDEIGTVQIPTHFTSPVVRNFHTSPLSAPPNARGMIREAADHIGLYDPVHDSGAAPRPVGAGFLLMILAVFGLMVLGLTWLNLGIKVAFISSVIAFAPAILYLSGFLWLDRFDPEPPSTLALAFAWGATISVFFSGIVNDLFGATLGDTLTSIVTAPIIEEAFKGIGVVLIAMLFRKDFDSIVDGIVYAGVVALGFATMENVDYYGRSLARDGMEGLAGTFFIRGILAPFSHVLFTCMTGLGCGIARETHNEALKIAAPMIGCLGAMLLHALWNTLASFDGGTFFTGYLLLEMPLFSGFIFVIAYLVRREGRILKQTLAAEVERGLIAPRQLEIAISVFRRTGWVASAFGHSELFNNRRRFLRSVAKLGLCRWHQARATEAMKDTGSFRMISRLQAEVLELRDRVG